MMNKKFDIYEMITNKIIARLEAGVVPWHQPWDIQTDMPINLITKRPYRGINFILLLGLHERPYYMTYKQIKGRGFTLKEGAKSHTVVFWKFFTYVSEDDQGELKETKTVPFLRYYYVFNVQDIDGVPESLMPVKPQREFKPILAAKNIVENWKDRPVVKHDTPNAFYRPASDEVHMPKPQSFHSGEEYYSTLFHELVHSTGHHARLDRFSKKMNHSFGSKDYSQEELVAEMGASFLCGFAGIENKTIDSSASYIKGWLAKFKGDRKILMNAASQAQKAADYILSVEN